jgi:hypothetical protein
VLSSLEQAASDSSVTTAGRNTFRIPPIVARCRR